MKSRFFQIHFTAVCLLAFWFVGQSVYGQTAIVPVCAGDSYVISVDSFNTSTVWQTSTDNSTWADSTFPMGVQSITVTSSATVIYYRALTTVDSCPPIASESVGIRLAEVTIADLGADTVCAGTEVSINPVISADGTPMIMWSSPDITIASPTDANQVFSNSAPFTAVLMVTDANGCSASANYSYDLLTPASSGRDTFVYEAGGANAILFDFPQCLDSVHLDLWGADGVDGEDVDLGGGSIGEGGLGGLGGYAGGDLLRDSRGDAFWIYLGGSDGMTGDSLSGGEGGDAVSNSGGGNGGGATEIRYGSADPSDMVASAGGGGGGGGAGAGPNAGFLSGGDGGDAGAGNSTGTSFSFGDDGVDPSSFSGIPAGGGRGGSNLIVPGGAGGSGSSCNDGGVGDTNGGFDNRIGGAGGDGGNGPAGCVGRGAGGGGGGGGVGASGGGGGEASSNSSDSNPGAGGGGGGCMSNLANPFVSPGIGPSTKPISVEDGLIILSW